jgi:uncharacterized iron-regulated protein
VIEVRVAEAREGAVEETNRMRRFAAVFAALLFSVTPAVSQEGAAADQYAIYHGSGERADPGTLLQTIRHADVLLIGELHDDQAGHRFKRRLLEEVDRGDPRQLVLSLEMFERDVQLVVDEYLAGFITEAHFMASARSWPNYERDYRPLVEYARAHGLPVVAANVPRRYVNAVARDGISVLDTLFAASRRWLPQLPIPEASDAYGEQFLSQMQGMHGHGGPSPERLLEAQRVWDAGMAESIIRAFRQEQNRLVMHVAGSFHVERDTGIPDVLRKLAPELRVVSLITRPGVEFSADDHGGLGDFVVIVSPDGT